MNAAGRLGAFAAGLALVFGGTFAAAGSVVPESVVADWAQDSAPDGGAGHDDHADKEASSTGSAQEGQRAAVIGVTIADSGYSIGPVRAPTEAGQPGSLSFQIVDDAGDPVTAYATAHGKELHLIVVRSDGTHYRHVHPRLDAGTGTWSLPWSWDAAGTYRVYADFTATGGKPATLSRTVDVAGQVDLQRPTSPVTRDTVDGFDVSVSGGLVAGTESELTIEVTRDHTPVTDLEPYLGAFGHLVALREGDLAYLHVHAHGAEPKAGDLAGPRVVFIAKAPTAGRYLLYLDFQVDGKVHTATFVLDAAGPSGAAGQDPRDHSSGDHSSDGTPGTS